MLIKNNGNCSRHNCLNTLLLILQKLMVLIRIFWYSTRITSNIKVVYKIYSILNHLARSSSPLPALKLGDLVLPLGSFVTQRYLLIKLFLFQALPLHLFLIYSNSHFFFTFGVLSLTYLLIKNYQKVLTFPAFVRVP